MTQRRRRADRLCWAASLRRDQQHVRRLVGCRAGGLNLKWPRRGRLRSTATAAAREWLAASWRVWPRERWGLVSVR